MKESKSLKTIVRGAYDIQKLRIQMGNRIVGNFKAKLGQEPGHTEKEIDAEGKQILANIRAAYKKITDGVTTFPRQTTFVGDEVISDYTELCLIAQYIDLEKYEDQHFRRLGAILNGYPIFTKFLKGIKGIGPAMAGVIISEIDIHKARYPSSLWRYAGLDVVGEWQIDHIEPISGNITKEMLEAIPERRPLEGDKCVVGEKITASVDYQTLRVEYQWNDRPESAVVIYKFTHTGGRSRRKEHLIDVKYIDKNGKPAERKTITFNPFLKTKLTGVLASSFLRTSKWEDVDKEQWEGEFGRDDMRREKPNGQRQVLLIQSPYAREYYNYRWRLQHHVKYGQEDVSDGHRHNMAVRFMIKRFLVDLYKAWRGLEDLPIAPEYHEAKLGHVHEATKEPCSLST